MSCSCKSHLPWVDLDPVVDKLLKHDMRKNSEDIALTVADFENIKARDLLHSPGNTGPFYNLSRFYAPIIVF